MKKLSDHSKQEGSAQRVPVNSFPRLADSVHGPAGDFFLLISDEGCKACERMKHALAELMVSEPRLCPAFLLDTDLPLAERVEAYQLADLPTLILYRDGEETIRWSGFFDAPFDHAREQMRRVLLSALEDGADR